MTVKGLTLVVLWKGAATQKDWVFVLIKSDQRY